MTDLDNTQSAPSRPDLDKLRAGVGSHQAAAYIVYLESLPCQRPSFVSPEFTEGEWRGIRRLLRKVAADPRVYDGDAMLARDLADKIP